MSSASVSYPSRGAAADFRPAAARSPVPNTLAGKRLEFLGQALLVVLMLALAYAALPLAAVIGVANQLAALRLRPGVPVLATGGGALAFVATAAVAPAAIATALMGGLRSRLTAAATASSLAVLAVGVVA
jgi:hypothetical protein